MKLVTIASLIAGLLLAITGCNSDTTPPAAAPTEINSAEGSTDTSANSMPKQHIDAAKAAAKKTEDNSNAQDDVPAGEEDSANDDLS